MTTVPCWIPCFVIGVFSSERTFTSQEPLRYVVLRLQLPLSQAPDADSQASRNRILLIFVELLSCSSGRQEVESDERERKIRPSWMDLIGHQVGERLATSEFDPAHTSFPAACCLSNT